MVNNQKKLHSCSVIFIALDTCLEKKSESKTRAERYSSEVCMHIDAREARI
jgi:hypothetical protein